MKLLGVKQGRMVLVMAGCLFGSLLASAQQKVDYPDYGALRNEAGNRMIQYFIDHPEKDMSRPENSMLRDMGNTDELKKIKLKAPSKKAMTGSQLYPLVKRSTLAVCQCDYREATKDYWLDIFATATVVTADGVCFSNYHVFEDVLTPQPAGTPVRRFIRFVMDCEGNVYPIKSILLADKTNDYSIFTIGTSGHKFTPMPVGNPAPEGEDVYCLSHPKGNLYYLTKGIVSRNLSMSNPKTGEKRYEMQMTADYAVCSSGGPVFDSCGNLVGLVGATNSLYADPNNMRNFQMSIKKAVPIKAIVDGLDKSRK